MESSQNSILSMFSQRLSWLGKRQEILSENIANVDTPDYRARDLKDTVFRSMLKTRTERVRLATTNKAHVGAAGAAKLASTGATGLPRVERDMVPFTPKADGGRLGNTVDLEDQLVKMSQTSAEYQFVTSLYRKNVNLIRIALGRGGR